jgi:DNA anti-recombination protein RmuC
MAKLDEAILEKKVRTLLAKAVKDGGSYTQEELREKLRCDMNALNAVMKRIMRDRLTRNLVAHAGMPDWLTKMTQKMGREVLKAIEERVKEDMAHRSLMAEEAKEEVERLKAEHERQLQEKDERIAKLEGQLQDAHTKIGEANGRMTEMKNQRADTGKLLLEATEPAAFVMPVPDDAKPRKSAKS